MLVALWTRLAANEISISGNVLCIKDYPTVLLPNYLIFNIIWATKTRMILLTHTIAVIDVH